MREILFRAKAINRIKGREYRTKYKNGDWVYGMVTKLYDERFPYLPAEMVNTDGVNGIDVDYKSISEFSGLTDKNGTKIFEGDIVILKGDEEEPFKVAFDECCFQIYGDSVCYCMDNFYDHDLEIIGNVFDNPNYCKNGFVVMSIKPCFVLNKTSPVDPHKMCEDYSVPLATDNKR